MKKGQVTLLFSDMNIYLKRTAPALWLIVSLFLCPSTALPSVSFPYNLIVTGVDGKELNLGFLKTEKAVIVAYTSSMPDCRERIGRFVELSSQFRESNLLFIAIDVGMSDSGEFLKNLPEEKGNVLFFQDSGRNLVRRLEIMIVPTTIFLSGEGNMVEKIESNYRWISDYFKEMVSGFIEND